MSRRQFFFSLLLYSLLIILPVAVASLPDRGRAVFNGFLANPTDGYSYLAKMEQGRAGAWGYRLAFSAEETRSHFLFAYYLFLGHLSRWLGMPTLVVFHLVRWLNGLILAIVLRRFIQELWKGNQIPADWVWFICLVGSGMGWLMIWTGYSPSDFWVAEAYPFLAGYTNPHFPLSIALILVGYLTWIYPTKRIHLLIPPLCGLLLAVIQPFGAVILGGLIGVDWLIRIRTAGWQSERVIGLLEYGLAALPVMILYQVDIARDPLLAAWNTQNVTPAAPWWDLIVSFSPGLVFAVIGLALSIRSKQWNYPVLWFWLIAGFGICFLPISLQRRFLIGIYIPLTILAANGLELIAENWRVSWLKKLKTGYIILAIPTIILLLILAGFGILSKHPDYYLSRDEADTLSWLHGNAKQGSIILADSRMGLYIPGATGLKVFYGHPYETPFAEQNKYEVEACVEKWDGQVCGILFQRANIRYVWVKTESAPSVEFIEQYDLNILHASPTVVLYEVQ